MALNHEFNDALGGAAAIRNDLNDNLMRRVPYVIGVGENPQSLDFTGKDVFAVVFGGNTFAYDSTDTTSVHDGTTVIVTSDGKRFKTDSYGGQPTKRYTIEDKDLTAPPGSPTEGDHYIVAAGATGDWAGQDDDIATYTARGWVFITPQTYWGAYIVDEASEYHYNASGDWVQGQPGVIISAASVGISELELGLGLAVENQTTNTPPGSPSAGDAYIIGPSPTGAWAGNPEKIARYENSAWVIYTPQPGWAAFDKAQESQFVYDGTDWTPISAGVAQLVANGASGSTFGTTAGSGTYSYSATTAPTTAAFHIKDTITVTHQARASGKTLLINYAATIECSSFNVSTYGILRDSEANAISWHYEDLATGAANRKNFNFLFNVTAPDTLSHTYTFAIWTAVAAGGATLANRSISLTEVQ